MLRKLLKYDFKTLLHTLLPMYAIALSLSIISNIFLKLERITPIFRVPTVFIVGLSVLVSVGISLVTLIIGIINFYKQTVKDEGYLLHTLPVSKKNIILSKLISLNVMQILSIIITIITFLITINLKSVVLRDLIKSIIEGISDYKITALLVFLTVIVGQITNTLLIYVSISFGQKHSPNKLLFSIIYGVAIYHITQIVTMIIYLPILLNENIVDSLNETIPESQALNIVLGISLIISFIIGTVYYIFTKKNLETKLNLE